MTAARRVGGGNGVCIAIRSSERFLAATSSPSRIFQCARRPGYLQIGSELIFAGGAGGTKAAGLKNSINSSGDESENYEPARRQCCEATTPKHRCGTRWLLFAMNSPESGASFLGNFHHLLDVDTMRDLPDSSAKSNKTNMRDSFKTWFFAADSPLPWCSARVPATLSVAAGRTRRASVEIGPAWSTCSSKRVNYFGFPFFWEFSSAYQRWDAAGPMTVSS